MLRETEVHSVCYLCAHLWTDICLLVDKVCSCHVEDEVCKLMATNFVIMIHIRDCRHKQILICSLCSHRRGGGLCHSASEAKACYRRAPSRNICACSCVMSTLRERRALYTSSAFKNPSLSMSNSVKIWSRGSIPEAMFFRLSQICKGALKSGRGCTLLSNDQTSACL